MTPGKIPTVGVAESTYTSHINAHGRSTKYRRRARHTELPSRKIDDSTPQVSRALRKLTYLHRRLLDHQLVLSGSLEDAIGNEHASSKRYHPLPGTFHGPLTLHPTTHSQYFYLNLGSTINPVSPGNNKTTQIFTMEVHLEERGTT